ncbi:MAG: 3-dehydroquinate synthase [Myxococcales bacterium]|nr:3-dehydroquinate synthase [Myxococcales bacterium]
MERIHSGSPPIYGGRDAASTLDDLWSDEWRQAAVIGDSNTVRFAEPLVERLQRRCAEVVTLSFEAGEASKVRATKRYLEDQLLARAFERSCCLVAVGGGVTTDLVGFVAATLLRGVAHINVATSLLAQIDAAIGGKCGVNTPHGKNLIGAFHSPVAVLLDLAALDSLPAAELSNGWAEGVKHAVLGDKELFDEIEQAVIERPDGALPLEPTLGQLSRMVAIKADIVARDEHERGRRQVLNFGHTVAHALETASGHRVAHGQAVAIGMLVEAELARATYGFPEEEIARLRRVLARLGLPTTSPLSFSALRPHLRHDKKNRGGRVQCALPLRIGTIDQQAGRWTTPLDVREFERAWGAVAEDALRNGQRVDD